MANIKYRDDLRENKILNQAKRDLSKIHNIHPSRIYQVVYVSYFAQAVCKNPSLRFFEQHLEASKVEVFAGETPGESIGKSETEIISPKCPCCKTANSHRIAGKKQINWFTGQESKKIINLNNILMIIFHR